MSGKPAKPPKHIPQRTCVGCRTVLPKRSLIRIVKSPAGVLVDPTGKLSGRGAYLHDRKSCWEKGLKGSLANALKTDLTQNDINLLCQFMDTLSEEKMNVGEQA